MSDLPLDKSTPLSLSLDPALYVISTLSAFSSSATFLLKATFCT